MKKRHYSILMIHHRNRSRLFVCTTGRYYTATQWPRTAYEEVAAKRKELHYSSSTS